MLEISGFHKELKIASNEICTCLCWSFWDKLHKHNFLNYEVERKIWCSPNLFISYQTWEWCYLIYYVHATKAWYMDLLDYFQLKHCLDWFSRYMDHILLNVMYHWFMKAVFLWHALHLLLDEGDFDTFEGVWSWRDG